MNAERENKQQATLVDWSIVLYPDIYKATESPKTVFAKLNCGLPVALFGRAKNDPRYDAEKGDAFADGHRLITSAIISIKDGKYHTQDTIYTLDENDKNLEFKKWCEDNQYKAIPLGSVWEKDIEQCNMLLLHICENCRKEQPLTSDYGYKQGWDYPPKMGKFKIISPRTCGDCGINTTLWREIACNKTSPDKLSEQHQNTLKRILTEPESIKP